MFGSLGLPELLLIFFVILIVFGPRRIPEIGRTLGKALGEFKKATDDLKSTIEREVRLEELKQVAPTIVAPFESIARGQTLEPSPGPAGDPAAPPAATGTPSSTTAALDDSTTAPEPPSTETAPSETASPEVAAEEPAE